jgi:hypothetical protein
MNVNNGILVKPRNPESSQDMLNLDNQTNVKVNREPKCAKVTSRDIAKMLIYALPIKLKPNEFLQCVEDTIKAIETMPKAARIALKMGYLFSSRVPRDDQQDFMQELTIKLIEIGCTDDKLAYSIARCDWVDWWRRYAKHNLTFTSLEAMLECRDDDQNEHIIADLAIGAMEYETRPSCKAQRILESMRASKVGQRMLEIGSKRLSGEALSGAERVALSNFIKRNAVYYLTNP